MAPTSVSRRIRVARIRLRTGIATTAVFAVSLGAVAAFGRQPANKSTTAAAVSSATITEGYSNDNSDAYDSSGTGTDGSYDSGGGSGSGASDPSAMTTRSS